MTSAGDGLSVKGGSQPMRGRVAYKTGRWCARLSPVLLVAGALALSACSSKLDMSALADVDPHDGVKRAHGLPVQGIDVSRYQGDIDWKAVRAAGVSFAYIKVSEGGDHVDDAFYDNWEAAARAGMPRGAYHFMYWCREAAEQAIWFEHAVPQDGSQLPPVLDLEWNNDSRTCPQKISRERALSKINIMLAAMERHTGKRPVIYTDITFHKDMLEGRYTGYEFWLRSVAAEPKERYEKRGWTFWQYTATGRVPGIKGNVDRNAFGGTPREFEQWLRKHRVDASS
jgi:lysozyme